MMAPLDASFASDLGAYQAALDARLGANRPIEARDYIRINISATSVFTWWDAAQDVDLGTNTRVWVYSDEAGLDFLLEYGSPNTNPNSSPIVSNCIYPGGSFSGTGTKVTSWTGIGSFPGGGPATETIRRIDFFVFDGVNYTLLSSVLGPHCHSTGFEVRRENPDWPSA